MRWWYKRKEGDWLIYNDDNDKMIMIRVILININ